MKVLIAGGGIGGMALAIALRHEGHDPLVLEQAPKLGFVGQGINLGANAVKALRYLGAADAVAQRAVRTSGWAYHDLESGAVQLEIPIGNRYGDEWYLSTHRADLLDALVARLDPADLRLNSRVADFRTDENGVEVVLADGATVTGDLLVGADGVKSVVRDRLFGADDSTFAKFVTWRAALPASAAPETAERQQLRLWSASQKFFVLYPIRDDLVNVSAYVPADEAARESWTAAGDISELREHFAEACGEVEKALDAMSNPLLTGIYVRDPLPTWVTERTALIGDAAHSMGPFSGNGGGLALEDAVTLAIRLRGVSDAASAARALREYEALRRPRATKLQTDARARMYTLSDPDLQTPRIRAGIWAGTMQIDPFSEAEYGWLYGHDPVAAAEAGPDVRALERSRPESAAAADQWRTALTFADHSTAWRGRRQGYERFVRSLEAPAPSRRSVELGGVPAYRVGDGSPGERIVVLLHGGGYQFGSAEAATGWGARVGAACTATVFMPDYRLAPEHPYPAALEDVRAAYDQVRADHPDAMIVVAGEDAGAGLALALTASLRDEGRAIPDALLLVSPFADLTVADVGSSPTGPADPWLPKEFATALAAAYAQTADPRSPGVSPLRGSTAGLPPTFVAAADDESLASDARALARSLAGSGVEHDTYFVPDSVHSFVLFPSLPESEEVLRRFAAFLSRI
ncbi:alpha/beta hydrolase fold domain-containing protein [Microbacterium sp. RD1]|uniref:alpha/beta hydrolase fold domain-containing protein n=1 Tax=Microbacterium sp. RD1 TaxID=3457313 RepID=UPI003FA57452